MKEYVVNVPNDLDFSPCRTELFTFSISWVYVCMRVCVYIYIYIYDLALINLQALVCHKTLPAEITVMKFHMTSKSGLRQTLL